MKSKYVLKNKQLFNKVIHKGKKLKNENYVIYFLPDFELKIGITIGKKLGNAPQRNYHKRVTRHICRNNLEKFPNMNIVIICRDKIKNIDFTTKEKSLLSLIERVKNEKQ